MNKEDWLKAEKKFDEVYDLEGDQREDFLNELRKSDESLYNNVMKILSFAEKTGTFLKKDVIAGYSALLDDIAKESEYQNLDGRTIGKFRIEKQIGSGGMGAVYLAERSDGSYEQKVALKFIRTGLSRDIISERFETEMQIQARLEHPGIPRLYDAGHDERGTPFLVMEYVDGLPITDFARNNNLTLEEKLRLFVKLCEVVFFAHQNLVVHRDLKPSNILITPDGDCKLLDFGISKLLDDDIGNLTHSKLHFFSLKYAAPEQVLGKPATTSTDIYSLGILLHEIICGSTPYDVENKSFSEIENTICEQPVSKPSLSLLHSGATSPQEADVRLSRTLKGDLDNIILKALEKDPLRRYPSVKTFSDDIERYLRLEPVEARPAGLLYTTGKFLQRNKIYASVAAIVVFVLIFGGVYHTAQIRAERDFALQETEKFEKMAGFMVGLFDYDDLTVPPEEASISNLLDAGVSKLDNEFGENPVVRAELMMAIGRSYLKIGNARQGQELIENAVQLIEAGSSTPRNGIGEYYYNLATVYTQTRHPQKFEAIEKAMQVAENESGIISHEYANVVRLRAQALRMHLQTHTEETEALLDEYLAIMTEVFTENDPEYGLALSEHALYQNDISKRLDLLKQALEVNLRLHGEVHPRVANVLNSIAFNLRNEDAHKSIMYYERALAIYDELYGDHHFRTITTLSNYGASLRRIGKLEETVAVYERTYAASREIYRSGSVIIADQQFWLANALMRVNRLDKAGEHLEEVLQVYQNNYEPGTQKVELARILLGDVYKKSGRESEGQRLLDQSVENISKLHGESHSMIRMARDRM